MAILAVLTVPLPGHGQDPSVDVERMLADRVLGAEDAPVTIIEYSSLTCGHCANFHRLTLPRIKEQYIDTGKVRLIFRDFPLDTAALAATMLTRCVPEEDYFSFLETVFREQATWLASENIRGALVGLAHDAGMSDADISACLSNGMLLSGVRERAIAGRDEFDINSTPSFIIEGEVVAGALPFEHFQEIIERALGDGGKGTDAAPALNPTAPSDQTAAEAAQPARRTP